MVESNNSRIVLLVEDSDDDAFFFERAFRSAGIPAELVRCADGGEAVAYLERACATIPHFSARVVLFLDLKLPILTGFEVLRWIRSHQLELHVIVLSGSELQADIELARQLGARDYLVKPISATDLKRHVSDEEMVS